MAHTMTAVNKTQDSFLRIFFIRGSFLSGIFCKHTKLTDNLILRWDADKVNR